MRACWSNNIASVLNSNVQTRLNTFFFFFFFFFLSRICLVGEKPDKELPGIVGARGDTV